jgi:hypothetical protein
VSEEYHKCPSCEKLDTRLSYEIAMLWIQSGSLLGTIAKFRQYIIYGLHKETLQKLANIFERTNHKKKFKHNYESINYILFKQPVVKRWNVSVMKKQTGQRQLKLITRLSNTRDYKLLQIFT